MRVVVPTIHKRARDVCERDEMLSHLMSPDALARRGRREHDAAIHTDDGDLWLAAAFPLLLPPPGEDQHEPKQHEDGVTARDEALVPDQRSAGSSGR